ncbi:MAG: BTAD domain-containing putative transcriptional regulator, partial [Gemmatimonadota bacterium]
MGSRGSSPVPVASPRLPSELTSFIGRERELAELRVLTAQHRLVTLTGPAGSGKTRLALELASTRDAGAAPVYWVELASLREGGLVPPAVAEAMGLQGGVRSGDTVALSRLLEGAPSFVVLDNCEQLVEACAELVDALLRACPTLSILATSREALGVPGERAWLVPPLGLPEAGNGVSGTGSEAVRLFVERARDVVPGFDLTPANSPVVADICRRLDGIPLAIELAAARVKVLSPADIRDRLDDVFRLLGSGGRTVVLRHRTLRASIDWSHDLLTDDARVLFRRLAVFRGGFGLDGAERVATQPPLDEEIVLELVARLVDRSLLGVGEHHGTTRYAYLEAVRQYATEKLVESGEEPAVRARHAAWIFSLVEEAEPHFIRTERRMWVERLQPDLDNIRSALAWSQAHDPTLHVRLVAKLWWFWFSTWHWTEGGRWIREALALPAALEPTGERAALLFAAGALAALQVRADLARPALEEAVELAEALADDRLAAYARNYLGMTYAGEERAAEAEALCGRAEAWFRDNDDLYGLRLAALLLGSAALGRGDLTAAESWNREGVRVARRFGQNRELAASLQNLGVVHLVAGQLDEAEALIREALAASLADPSLYFIATGVAYMGEIEAARGRPSEAARLLGAAQGIRDRIGALAFPLDARRQESALIGVRERMGEVAFEAAWADGRHQDVDALVQELAEPSATRVPAPTKQAASAVAPAEVTTATDSGSSAVVGTATTSGEAPLRVDALGPVLVSVEGVAVDQDRWVYAKPRELLAYLLLHPKGGTRDQIGEALWPGAPRSNLKNSFHVTLHHLRKALGHPEWVVAEAERYRLDPELRYAFDVDEFERRARAALRPPAQPDAGGDPTAPLRATLALYRGELLEGEPAARWIDDHRDRLRRLQVELTLALGAALEADRPREAADLYQRLAYREELDEEVHRRLMTAWHRAGNRVAALRHYERVVGRLRSELDAEPEP